MLTLSVAPVGKATDLKDSPCLVRKSLARSQSEYLVNGVTKTWKAQSFAETVIGVLSR